MKFAIQGYGSTGCWHCSNDITLTQTFVPYKWYIETTG